VELALETEMDLVEVGMEFGGGVLTWTGGAWERQQQLAWETDKDVGAWEW
jgi:hypothetical protein